MIHAGNSLIVFPAMDEDINIVDLASKEIKVYQGYPSDFEYQAAGWGWTYGWSQYFGYCEDEDYYYFAMRSANYVLKVNKENGEFIWIKPNIPSREEMQRLKVKTKYAMGNTLFYEDEMTIIDLAKMDLKNGKNQKSKSVGSKIYKEIAK